MKKSLVGLAILSFAATALAEVDTNSEVYKKAYDKAYADKHAELAAKSDTKTTEQVATTPSASVEWYIQGNAAYARHVASGIGTNLYGAEFAVGLNFARTGTGYWSTQVSSGYMKSKEEPMFSNLSTPTEQIDAIPVIFGVNYNFAISKSGNSTFFVGPYFGGYFVKDTLSNGAAKISASDSTAVGGINLGFNINVVEHCDLVISGSAGKIGGFDFDYGSGLSRQIESGEVYTLRVGVKLRF